MASRKQRAAAKRNIKKAHAANRARGRRKSKRKPAKRKAKGHVPLEVLTRRLHRLGMIVHKRGGTKALRRAGLNY